MCTSFNEVVIDTFEWLARLFRIWDAAGSNNKNKQMKNG